MAMIRQADLEHAARDAIVLNLGDLVAQGEAITRGARAEAARILDAAACERSRLLADARQAGHAEGMAAGRDEGRRAGLEEGRALGIAEARERLKALEVSLASALERFEARRDRLFEDAREGVLRLAIVAAEKITKRRLALDPSLVRDQVSAALDQIARPGRVVVRVHPDDEGLAGAVLPNTAAALRGDARLSRGSCVIEAEGGAADASIETQLARLAEALLPNPAGATPGEAPVVAGVPDGPGAGGSS